MNKIIELINSSEKSRYRISKETGINSGNLRHMVQGKQKDINLKTAFKLAGSLGVDINEFREGGLNE